MSIRDQKNIIKKFSRNLFWDIDEVQLNLDSCPSQIIQRVLEYGQLNDWYLIRDYYGIPKIAEYCQQLRTLDPNALSFICCVSNTDKRTYRCYNFAQYIHTPWNS